MKHALFFFILLFSCPVFSQKTFIRLPQQFEHLYLDSTNVKQAKKMLGRPSEKQHTETFALMSGTCLHFYIMQYIYRQPDCKLVFSSNDRGHKNRQKLQEIILQKGTVFAPDDFIQIGESTEHHVCVAFGNPVSESEVSDDIEYTLSYDLTYQQQDVRADFIFDGNHILKRVSVSMY